MLVMRPQLQTLTELWETRCSATTPTHSPTSSISEHSTATTAGGNSSIGDRKRHSSSHNSSAAENDADDDEVFHDQLAAVEDKVDGGCVMS